MKQFVKIVQEEKFLVLSLLFLCVAGVGAMEYPQMQMLKIIRVIVLALVGIIGAIKVHKKLKSGASDIQATAMDWFGSFLILTIGNNIIASFVM